MANKTFNTRVKNKRDTAANWEAVATTFQPLDGELIIVDTAAGKTRFKVGRYDTAKGRLLYYNEIPFTDEYLYNDLNESQGKIYDKLKGIDDKSIIEMTLEPSDGNGKVCVYHIGLWQFPKTGLYKIHLTQHGTTSDLFKVFARKTKDDGTLPEDFTQDNLVIQQLAMGDTQVNDLYIQVDYTDNDKLTVYNVRFLTLLQPYNAQVNVYDKTTQKWQFVSATYVQSAKSADRLAHQLTLTKGDTTTKFDGSTAQAVEIPTKTSELTNDSNFTTQTDLDNLTNTVVSYNAQENITDEQKATARTNIGAISSSELVQSDWNQNDTTAKDYIKNRICYEGETVTELGNTAEVWHNLTNGLSSTPISYRMNGKIYKDLTAVNAGGNDRIVYNGSSSEAYLVVVNYTSPVSQMRLNYPSDVTDFQFVKIENTVKQIDPKFIPTVSPDWNQNDETAKDYVKNRPGAYFKTANNTVFTQNTSEITWTEKPNENAPDMGYVILDNIPEFVDGLEYKVHWGDTLYAVAAKYSLKGNDTAFEFGGSNGFTNYPFYIIFTFENGTNILGIVVENKTNIPSIFSIEGSTGLIKKIPEACIEPLDKQIRVFCDEYNPSEYQIKRLYLSNIENKLFSNQDNYVYYLSDKNNPDCYNLRLGSDIPAYFDYRFYLSWGSTLSDWKPAIGKSKTGQTIKNTQSNIYENKLLLNLYTYRLSKAYAVAILNMEDTFIAFNIYNDNLVSTSTRPQAIGFTVYDNILYRIVFTAKNFSTNGVVEYTVTSMCDLSNIASKSDIPTIDTALSSTSENPVQNKVITTEIQAINNKLSGLTGAMHFIGKATVDITDGSTTDPQIANYTTKEKGDVILGKDDHKEFVWNGAIWEELGDEGSYALKTTTINGKALSDNITLTASDVGAASASTIETMQAAIDSKPSAADAVYTATAASTDGAAYTATVSGIDSLAVGASFIMIPNKASTSKAPTLNVNGLGAKPIRRRLSSLTTSLQQGYSTNWISLNKPFTVVYDGTAWVIEGLTKTDGADVYGAVAQATADAKGNNIADTYATIAMLQSLLPKVTTITLTSNWVGDASPYYQDIALSCVTETSIVDLQPTPEQLNSWQDDGIAFTTLSGNGTVRVYVAGGKPSSAISVQVRVQEVTVI